MSHECPICMQACYCDSEDHDQPAPADCCHDCDEDEDEDEDMGQFAETPDRDKAKMAGEKAFSDGLPYVAPRYGWGDAEACWRLGYKMAAARAGVSRPRGQ